MDDRQAKRKMMTVLREIESLSTGLGRLREIADRLDLHDLGKRIDWASDCAAETITRMRRGIATM
ncbi:MAG TPA: hypothetical protein VEJ16_07900 [Alphaproteobacteria bacterium]|nr:hypothetical protein [Alphaproteobacteria bacterium]